MKLCLVLVVITCLIGGLNAQTCSSSSCQAGYTCHVVQSGDTVITLVGGNTTCINSVYALYPYSQNYHANTIYPGEVLCIPSGCLDKNGCGQRYTVVSGDTCITIAASLGTTVAHLYNCNPVINQNGPVPCNNLIVKQTIYY